MGLLESHINEIATKVEKIDEMVGCVEAMFIPELMVRIEVLENKATNVGGSELGIALQILLLEWS